MSAVNFFSGWLGIGTALLANAVTEPADTAYVRRPIVFGPLFGNRAQDVGPGTIGPAVQDWGTLIVAGLATWTLAQPLRLAPGRTWTTGGQFAITLSGDPATSPLVQRSWVAGSQIGTTPHGAPVVARQNLQLAGGQLSFLGGGGAVQSLGNLPNVSPPAGSGVLWNNGGVICIA